jgi:uncharacterized protein YbjT (DUF2867 family)
MSGKILVIGSRGTVGQHLVKILSEAGEQVRAATTALEQYQAAKGVEPVRFDLADASPYAAALDGVDRVFLLAPTGYLNPYELLAPFVDAVTRDQNRKIVLQTAMGVTADDGIDLRRVELLIEKSGAPYVFLRPNWFSDNFHSYWLEMVKHGVIALPVGDSRTSFIDARDIAASAAAALQSQRFDCRAFALTGSESLTYVEAAAQLSQAVGREITFVDVDEATFIQSMMAAGVPEANAGFLAGILGMVKAGYAAAVTPDVQELTGRAPITVAQYARDYAGRWK